MRPRRSSGVVVRPLNFTVRSHLGASGFAKKMGKLASIGSSVTLAAADSIVLQASAVNATGCACGWPQLRSRSGCAP